MRRYCKIVGNAGEDYAARMLEDTGYTIIERNFRTRVGEIDIIAYRDGVLHFIEVKTRTGDEFGYPADAVTESKQITIRRAAEIYLGRRRAMWHRISFDVVEITFNLIEDCMCSSGGDLYVKQDTFCSFQGH